MLGRTIRIVFVLAFATACQTSHKQTVHIAPPERVLEQLQAQAPVESASAPTVVLDHKYFEIHYAPDYKLAKYVKYTLTAADLRKRQAKRKDKFFADPLLLLKKLPALAQNAFAKSGYHRGHLAPAEDFRGKQEAVNQTFVMSNMAPQKPSLNTGPWKRLEGLVRRFACGEERITVITGPILRSGLSRLPSGAAVPEQFFKVVIDETPPRKAIAYILNQNDRGDVLRDRIVSFDEIQQKTSEDFVADLRSEEQERKPAQANGWKEADCD